MHWQAARDTLLKTFLSHNRLGLITDVDGTISPIVDQPDAAQVTPHSRELLAALHQHLALVAVISGRAVADVRERVGLPQLVYAGNHGLEHWIDGETHLADAALRYRPALEAVLAALKPDAAPGVILEDKGVTLSIHYRMASDPAHTADHLAQRLTTLTTEHGLRLVPGRMIFEVRPPLEVNKGTAFTGLVERYRLDAALFIGDDTTDVDAVQAAQHLRATGMCYALGVGVESDHMPDALRESADLFVSNIQDVETLLAWLLSAVMASAT